MEDSFNARVGKIFGSLNSSASSSASSSYSSSSAATPGSSLWCLTDDEIPRREWKRDSPEPQPSSATLRLHSLSSELDDDLEDTDDDDIAASTKSAKPDDYDDQEWEIKSSIGLDSTLDYEEEEDQYDKVAVGNEKPDDRLYMRDVEDYGIDIDSGTELPLSWKDPRANHLAAKIRLKEDDDAAKNILSLRVSADGAFNPKSILKRKDSQLDNKSHKRVRFDPECVNTLAEARGRDHASTSSAGVPDYLLNPARYTRYAFDSSTEVNEDSNKQAYMDFLQNLGSSRSSSQEEQDASFDPSRSVTFIPRKKTGDTTAMIDCCTELVQQVGIGKDATIPRRVPTGIAASDSQENMVACAMEEDEPDPEAMASKRTASQKSGRQYRTKARPELDDC